MKNSAKLGIVKYGIAYKAVHKIEADPAKETFTRHPMMTERSVVVCFKVRKMENPVLVLSFISIKATCFATETNA